MKELNTQKTQNQFRNKFLKSGVKMLAPETIFFSKDTKLGKNVTIEPYVVFGLKSVTDVQGEKISLIQVIKACRKFSSKNPTLS